MIPVFF